MLLITAKGRQAFTWRLKVKHKRREIIFSFLLFKPLNFIAETLSESELQQDVLQFHLNRKYLQDESLSDYVVGGGG